MDPERLPEPHTHWLPFSLLWNTGIQRPGRQWCRYKWLLWKEEKCLGGLEIHPPPRLSIKELGWELVGSDKRKCEEEVMERWQSSCPLEPPYWNTFLRCTEGPGKRGGVYSSWAWSKFSVQREHKRACPLGQAKPRFTLYQSDTFPAKWGVEGIGMTWSYPSLHFSFQPLLPAQHWFLCWVCPQPTYFTRKNVMWNLPEWQQLCLQWLLKDHVL